MKWRKQHKWFGIAVSLFLLMFCLSGIVLNHRHLFSDMEISRRWLPSRYGYKQWNGGLMRGTLRYNDSVIIYGANGIFLSDTLGKTVAGFNHGLPAAADHRQVRNVIMARGNLFAATLDAVYLYEKNKGWKGVALPTDKGERISDITSKGDSIIAVGRSFLYLSAISGEPFTRVQLKKPADYNGKVSLFRTTWLLHSGELFGAVGKTIVDLIAIILIFLCLTGIAAWLLPLCNKKRKRRPMILLRFSSVWHNKAGRWTIVLTLLIAITGWCLRPPMMIPLAMNKTKALPLTTLDSPNPWNGRLRMLRYDDATGDWLLSTSEGFFALNDFASAPVKIRRTPPVSVMGLNVLQKDRQGDWLCGSFSGMFVWDRRSGKATDFFTHESAPEKSGAPFGKKAISGYSQDFAMPPFAVEYYGGAACLPQPAGLSQLPMSLWNLALEIHSGRIYVGSYATLFFVFFAGAAVVWCLWSGWKVRRR